MVDIYYDNEKFSLSRQNIWLRKRGENFELKIPLNNEDKENFYEVEGEMAIREIFAIPIIKSFTEDIAEFGYNTYFTCQSSRSKSSFADDRKKILQYLKRNRFNHYKAIVDAGVI